MPEKNTKRKYTKKKSNTVGKAIDSEKTEKLNKKKVGKPRQSIARLTAKTVARTAVRRTITGIFGNGLVGSLLGAVASHGIRQTDKVTYNEDFGMFHKK